MPTCSSSLRENIPSLLATASNTWGLLILTLLLGYGLVEVPRTLWNTSRRTYSLNHCYFSAAKLYIDMSEREEKLKDVTEVCVRACMRACVRVCTCVCACVHMCVCVSYKNLAHKEFHLHVPQQRVSQIARSVHYNDPFRKYVNVIIKKFPKDMQGDFSKGHDDYEDYRSTQDPLTKSSLESLLKQSMKAVRYFNSTKMWVCIFI